MNIKFCYLYRDGSNYKNFNEVVFANPNSRTIQDVEKMIREKLIDSQWFYCNHWNIPDMHFTEFNYSPDIDHDWHEFEAIEITAADVTELNSIEDFLLLVTATKLPC